MIKNFKPKYLHLTVLKITACQKLLTTEMTFDGKVAKRTFKLTGANHAFYKRKDVPEIYTKNKIHKAQSLSG